MFTKVRRELKKDKHYRIGQRLAVEPAHTLLLEQRYHHYLGKVKELAHLPEEHFDRFYQTLLQRYVDFVQLIPEDAQEPLGSLLTNALLRAINTLNIFVKEFSDATPLERFALFSACLLQKVERVVSRNKLLIVNKAGATIKLWQPFSHSLVQDSDASFYKIIPLRAIYHRMEKPARVTLAKSLLGDEAFLSLASDTRLLMEWWQALLEEEEGGLSRLQYAMKIYRRGEDNLIDELPLDIEIFDSPATEHADAFLEWLINGLDDNSLSVNIPGAPIHVTEMGIFLQTGVFTIFAERYNPGLVDAFTVERQFKDMIGELGIESEVLSHAAEKSSFANPFSKKTAVVHQGVLVFDSATVTQSSSVSTHVKLPHNVKRTSYQSFVSFTEQMRTSMTLQNR